VRTIIARLAKAHPDWGPTLDFTTPLELLVATILAAQARDERVNEVTKPLFARYRTARDWLRVPDRVLERELKPTGFFRQKTKAIKGACQGLVERFRGRVPRTMDELVTLRGVGRKTASIVLGNAFGVPAIAVDRHVARVASRLGFTRSGDPAVIEDDLRARLPKSQWVKATWCLVLHGRRICRPTPECPRCPVRELCPYGLARMSAGAGAPARGRATAEPRSGYPRKTVALSAGPAAGATRRRPRAPRRPEVRHPSQG
jgi:endonuclease-3